MKHHTSHRQGVKFSRIGFTHPRWALNERADCAVVAVAVARGISYLESHSLFAALGRKPRCGAKLSLFMFPVLGLERDFAFGLKGDTVGNLLPRIQSGTFVIRTRDHMFVARNGVIRDASRPKLRSRIQAVYQVKDLTYYHDAAEHFSRQLAFKFTPL